MTGAGAAPPDRWEQGDIEPTAVLRRGIVRFRVNSTGNWEDGIRDTALIVEALNWAASSPAAGLDPEEPMTRAKELLDAATSLPWFEDTGKIGADDTGVGEMDKEEDAALIVYAVNSLPAYEELRLAAEEVNTVGSRSAWERFREAIRRLQEQTR